MQLSWQGLWAQVSTALQVIVRPAGIVCIALLWLWTQAADIAGWHSPRWSKAVAGWQEQHQFVDDPYQWGFGLCFAYCVLVAIAAQREVNKIRRAMPAPAADKERFDELVKRALVHLYATKISVGRVRPDRPGVDNEEVPLAYIFFAECPVLECGIPEEEFGVAYRARREIEIDLFGKFCWRLRGRLIGDSGLLEQFLRPDSTVVYRLNTLGKAARDAIKERDDVPAELRD